jgi:hypothetical protein
VSNSGSRFLTPGIFRFALRQVLLDDAALYTKFGIHPVHVSPAQGQKFRNPQAQTYLQPGHSLMRLV